MICRARDAIARISAAKLANIAPIRTIQKPRGAYILILDQTRDDAAVRASGGNDAYFPKCFIMRRKITRPSHRYQNTS